MTRMLSLKDYDWKCRGPKADIQDFKAGHKIERRSKGDRKGTRLDSAYSTLEMSCAFFPPLVKEDCSYVEITRS
jgi:hypothetical protein